MKIKSTALSLLLLAFTMMALSSCKDKKAEPKTETHEELHASATFQCPMDCEDGKTYEEPGTCPVCKMDLQEVKQGDAVTCTVHKDGNCICEGEKCECDNCPMHI